MSVILQKRMYYYTDSSSWEWGRWLLLALLVVGLLVSIFLMNFHRRKHGNQPIVGTSWLAPPPSYFQSQRQNRYNDPAVNEQPLPLYTANANQNDLGYYDNEGKFVPTSPENDYYQGFPIANANTGDNIPQGNDTTANNHSQNPAGLYSQSGGGTQGSSTVYDEDVDLTRPQPAATADSIYQRPPGPPPTVTTTRTSTTNP